MFADAAKSRGAFGGIRPPHLYDHDGPGALLCLYWPKNGEWDARLKLANTYIVWMAEWLWYFATVA